MKIGVGTLPLWSQLLLRSACLCSPHLRSAPTSSCFLHFPSPPALPLHQLSHRSDFCLSWPSQSPRVLPLTGGRRWLIGFSGLPRVSLLVHVCGAWAGPWSSRFQGQFVGTSSQETGRPTAGCPGGERATARVTLRGTRNPEGSESGVGGLVQALRAAGNTCGNLGRTGSAAGSWIRPQWMYSHSGDWPAVRVRALPSVREAE